MNALRPTIPGSVCTGYAAVLATLLLPGIAARADVDPPAATGTDIVITGALRAQRALDAPYAITTVDSQALREAGPLVNLSEALVRVPGLVVANRNNYAQDLQISSRGFGARAGFGVRGIRLVADGIPASMPDGQGQVAHFDLAGAARVEVLRGPFSVLYGSNSGGVIALVGAPAREPRIEVAGDAADAGLRQVRIALATPLSGGFDLKAGASHLDVAGFRPKSSASRQLAHLRLGWQGPSDSMVLLASAQRQRAADPLGLSPQQFAAQPRQTTAQAQDFDTRKTTSQFQAGMQWRHRFDGAGALEETQFAIYAGERDVTQFLAIPQAIQANPRHGGGVVDLARTYRGLDWRILWRWQEAMLMLGLAQEEQRDDRRGYENFLTTGAATRLGVRGALRREEVNRARTRDAYAQIEWPLTTALTATLGARSGRLEVAVDDRFTPFSANNPDDSGDLQFDYTNPVLGLRWALAPGWSLHASAAVGNETPTLGELAYRADNSGFNTDLRAQRSRQAEIGSKWRGAAWEVDLTAFSVRTQDELAVSTNAGGRASFQNVGGTRRHGAELALRWQAAAGLRWQAALSTLSARYSSTFNTCAALPCPTATNPAVSVPAGNRIAGTQARQAWSELAWRPGGLPGEFAVEVRGRARTAANDRNTVFAPGFGLVHLRWSHTLPVSARSELQWLLRIDNTADRAHVGSVIVNDANGRVFEPGEPRSLLGSVRWVTRW